MNRRSIAINGGLAAALVAVVAVGLASIGSPSSASAGSDNTTTVRTADLSATVSATGNVSSATDVAVNFQGTGGTVTAIYVTPGQKVLKGQRLAAVDDTSAQQSLASAQANLASATGAVHDHRPGADQRRAGKHERADRRPADRRRQRTDIAEPGQGQSKPQRRAAGRQRRRRA